MLKNRYENYIESNRLFIKRLVIKSDYMANRINYLIKKIYGADSVNMGDLTTWKYYKNLAGEYHEKDEVMKVISLDTLTEIDFTKENLQVHTATKEAYQNETTYYYELIKRYPSQEVLIHGIVRPVDIYEAIAAKNYQIIYYDDTLLESQEKSVLIDLQNWFYNYTARWDINAYGLISLLYPAAQHAEMYLNALCKLINLRLARVKTYEAHSFHIKAYLASHLSANDKDLDYLTIEQLLFLYRNVQYLKRHTGHQSTLQTLIDHLLTPSRIPIAEFRVKQNRTITSDLFIGYHFQKNPLNTQFNVPSKNAFTLNDVVIKETPLAPFNDIYFGQNQTKIDTTFKTTQYNNLPSKMLESTLIDYTNIATDNMFSVFMRYWCFLSAQGLYSPIIVFKDIITNDDISLPADKAFLYATYLFLRSIGEMRNDLLISEFYCWDMQRTPKPSVEELLSVIPVEERYRYRNRLLDILSQQPSINRIQSIASFYTTIKNVYKAEVYEWKLLGSIAEMRLAGFMRGGINYAYCDQYVRFSEQGTRYVDFITQHRLPDHNLTYQQVQDQIVEIFNRTTGYEKYNPVSKRDTHTALMNIMKALTSYSVQFIYETVDEPVTIIPGIGTRIDHPKVELGEQVNIEPEVEIREVLIPYSQTIGIDKTEMKHYIGSDITTAYSVEIPETVKIEADTLLSAIHSQDITLHFKLGDFYIQSVEYVSDENNIIHYDLYENLSLNQKNSLLDVYQH